MVQSPEPRIPQLFKTSKFYEPKITFRYPQSSGERGELFLAKVFETDSARIPDLKQQIR
jgi:hypothetical protein